MKDTPGLGDPNSLKPLLLPPLLLLLLLLTLLLTPLLTLLLTTSNCRQEAGDRELEGV